MSVRGVCFFFLSPVFPFLKLLSWRQDLLGGRIGRLWVRMVISTGGWLFECVGEGFL